MISTKDALQTVLNVSKRLPPVTVSLHDALDRVLAEDIRAPDPLPPYPASVKNGYAVVAAGGPGEYPVITESRAGNDAVGVTVTPGTVAYITTGAPIPDGADALVQGVDIQRDAIVLISGERLGVSEIGLLATVGVTMVKVYPTPTVPVLSTGDELVEPTTGYMSRGQIRDSNRAILVAAAIQHQCKVLDLGIAKDDEELGKILDNAFNSGINILLTSGGVSVGDRDSIKPLLEKNSFTILKLFSNTGSKIMTMVERL